jgi:4-hydroxy-tetrahydrodipicolinate synthase
MKPKYPLRGIVVSLNTPFDSSGYIDFDSLGRAIELHLRDGCSGFLSPAQAGEVGALTVAERIEIIRFVQGHVRGRAAFIAGATADDELESVIVAEAALKAGCEAVLVEVPRRFRADRIATINFCRSIAQAGMPVLVLQDLDWNGFGLETAWIVELFENIEAFRCLKIEVRPAGPKYSQVIEATGGCLTIAGGWAADQMIEALDRGVDIYMPTAMTRLYLEVMRNHSAGNRDAAKAWFHRILPVLAFTRQHLDISIQFYKRLFYQRGLFSTAAVRKVCLPYDDYHERYGQELIRYVEDIEISANLVSNESHTLS